jgi:hypothetical protein
MLNYKELKKKYILTDHFFADAFGYKNYKSYTESKGKPFVTFLIVNILDRYENRTSPKSIEYRQAIRETKFPGHFSYKKKQRYKRGLYTFIKLVEERKGRGRDPAPRLLDRSKPSKWTLNRKAKCIGFDNGTEAIKFFTPQSIVKMHAFMKAKRIKK